MLQACFNTPTKGFQLKHGHILRLEPARPLDVVDER